jgi:hypothetical protein
MRRITEGFLTLAFTLAACASFAADSRRGQ